MSGAPSKNSSGGKSPVRRLLTNVKRCKNLYTVIDNNNDNVRVNGGPFTLTGLPASVCCTKTGARYLKARTARYSV